jgi:hypothetical protein
VHNPDFVVNEGGHADLLLTVMIRMWLLQINTRGGGSKE